MMDTSEFLLIAATLFTLLVPQRSGASVPCIGQTIKRPSFYERMLMFTSSFRPSTPECIIDIGTIVNITFSNAVVYLAVGCRHPTDIILVNHLNISRKDIITYLMLQGQCQTSLPDIARFSNASDLRVLLLIRGAKIRVQNYRPVDVKALAPLGTLHVETSRETDIQGIFLDNQWPLMAEITFANLSIQTFPDAHKRSMPHLQSLSLNHNRLKTPPAFPWDHEFLSLPRNLTRKAVFNQQYQEGTIVQPNLYRRFLLLEFNKIQNLSLHEFRGYLHKLSLKGNTIHKLGPNCFTNITGLNVLDLSMNDLKVLPKGVFRGLYSLLEIRLDVNKISVLHNDLFIDCTRLKRLHLNDNRLHVIPKDLLAKHEDLQEIHLESNAIVHILQGALPYNSNKLKKLFLQNNMLTSPPASVFCMRSLKKLYFTNNRITFQGILQVLHTIPLQDLVNFCLRESGSSSTITLRTMGTYVDLANNNITSLDIHGFEGERRLKVEMILTVFEMNLKDNPIRCDCRTLHIQRVIKKLIVTKPNIKEDHFYSWVCNTPPELKGKRLVDVSERDLLCVQDIPGCPRVGKCLVRGTDGAIIIFARHKHLKHLPLQMPIANSLEIHLDNNEIVHLRVRSYLSNVTVLHLSRNKIQNLHKSFVQHLTKLRELKLDSNRLKRLPPFIATLTSRAHFVSLAIHNNFLLCDCHARWIPAWLRNVSSKIEDIENVKCASGKSLAKPIYKTPLQDFKCEQVEPTSAVKHIVISVVLAIVLVITIIVFVLFCCFKGEMKVFLYTHFNWHPFDLVADDHDPKRIYDAFISYSNHDSTWVRDLRIRLESHSPPYKICFHERDFEVGATISENILNSVNQSKRMIIVLSNNFLESEWCRFEFRAAHQRVLQDKTNDLIIILFDDVDSQSLDEEARLYLRTNTYLSVSNKWFWQKLLYALPTPREETTCEESNELQATEREKTAYRERDDTSL